jgi:outer membrane protein assembly factor BamD (BamD/ComL family)
MQGTHVLKDIITTFQEGRTKIKSHMWDIAYDKLEKAGMNCVYSSAEIHNIVNEIVGYYDTGALEEMLKKFDAYWQHTSESGRIVIQEPIMPLLFRDPSISGK